MNLSRFKTKMLLFLVGASSSIVGMIAAYYGIARMVGTRNTHDVLIIAIGAILFFVGDQHLHWLQHYGLEENFNYKQKLKAYIPLFIILLLIILVESCLIIRDGNFFIHIN